MVNLYILRTKMGGSFKYPNILCSSYVYGSSKALLNNSHYYHMAKSGDLAKRGVSLGSVELDLPALMSAKDTAVREAIQ